MELRDFLKKCNHEYYVLNRPTISDFEYDTLMKELEFLENEYPEFASSDSPTKKVGSDLEQQ